MLSKLLHLNRWLRSRVAALRHQTDRLKLDSSGSVAIVAATSMPMLVGGIGLGAEVGYWYLRQRVVQHAADVAAFSAAVRLKEQDSQSRLESVALNVAIGSGFRNAQGTIAVYAPPTTGPGTGNPKQVEVVVRENAERFFTQVFSREAVWVEGRAVAEVLQRPICVLALNPTANSALQFKGSSSGNFGCSVASNSTANSAVDIQGASTLTAECVYTPGLVSGANSTNLNTTDCEDVETRPFATSAFRTLSVCKSSVNLNTNSFHLDVIFPDTATVYVPQCPDECGAGTIQSL